MSDKKLYNPKHIGMIHYTLPPAIAGVEMVIRDHARLLSTYGYKLFLLGASGKKFRSEIAVQLTRSFDPKNKAVLAMQEELKNQEVSPIFYTLKNRYIRSIKHWIEANKLGTVIVHNLLSRHYNLALTAAVVEVAQSLHGHVRFITWVHDASFVDSFYTKTNENLKDVYPWNLLATYQKYFTYVTISQTRKYELKNLYGKDKKILVIPNGIDINKMLPLPRQTRMLFRDMLVKNPDYIGLIPVRITERKNIEYAIELCQAAKEKYNINFIFIVTGALHLLNPETVKYYDYLKGKIKEYSLEDNFFFLYNYKFANGDKFDIYKLSIKDLYLISDFLLLPSKGEGFGLPIIEAGFMRIPIFTASLPVFKEVGNGYIHMFSLDSPPEVTVRKIVSYLRRNRSTLFHKVVLRKYALDAIVRDKLIAELLQSKV